MNKLALPSNAVIGMVHVQALPGTPMAEFSMAEILQQAVQDAEALIAGGVDAIMIENMHDRPFLKGNVGPEIIASMTAVACKLRALTSLPLGIQMLAAANEAALAVAHAASFNFIRVEGFVFGHVADEGYIDGCAGALLRYRKQIGAENIAILADIKKKHSSHAITADVDIAETARAAEFFLADGVIVTGTRTGATTDLAEIHAVKAAVKLPVYVGSGVTADSISTYLAAADGVIVGTDTKHDGDWRKAVSSERVRKIMTAARGGN